VKSVNQEVVEGIVRILRRRNDLSQPKLTKLQDLLMVGIGANGVSSEAKTYIVEFLKDGLSDMKPDQVEAILREDYTKLWRVVNKYLGHFGLLPVQPVPLTP
jgi:lysophospholipase L1-like esterase